MATGIKRPSKSRQSKASGGKKFKKSSGPSKPPISAAAASAALKRYAAKQRVQIELTEDQMHALQRQLGLDTPSPLDPRRPFNITFVVKGRSKAFSDFNVASCAYWGDTCCAER
ncbi:MAG: hypothetical protein C5B58_15860 [Acidobacteria bacterium]|nr:MAG: hypothetical protein C5B58_15860 [Acidobacteriota bacterium]